MTLHRIEGVAPEKCVMIRLGWRAVDVKLQICEDIALLRGSRRFGKMDIAQQQRAEQGDQGAKLFIKDSIRIVKRQFNRSGKVDQ